MVAPYGLLVLLVLGLPIALAAETPIPVAAPCVGPSARWPANVLFLDGLEHHAQRMLQQSATAQRQCREIAAAAATLYVRVQINVHLMDRPYRARSVVHRTVDGAMLAFVDVGGRGHPAEWIAHELEHVLEQLEGVCLETLRQTGGGAWLTAADTFESARAIEAGRQVRSELAVSKR